MKTTIVFLSLQVLSSQSANILSPKNTVQDKVYADKINATSQKKYKKKILIVYYSLSGNTKTLINIIKKELDKVDQILVDVEELHTPNIKRNFFNNLKLAILSLWDANIEIDSVVYDPTDYTDIVICFPIWIGTAALPIHSYLRTFKTLPSKVHIITTYQASSKNSIYNTIEHLENKYNFYTKNSLLIESSYMHDRKEEIEASTKLFAKKIISQ